MIFFNEKAKLKAEIEALKKELVETLQKFKAYAIEKEPSIDKEYLTIKSFDKKDVDYVKSIAAISDSEELAFMLHDLKQECVENMINGSVEVNLQMTGILKGLDLVIKNLCGFKILWTSMLKASENNV